MKKKIEELSIFRGKPAFKNKLHVGKPNLPTKELLFEKFNKIIDNKWLTNNGPFVQELEIRIADYLGVKHCIAICNGTIALEIVIRAMELKGEVILPSFTFIASAHSLQWQEITPVFCDIEPNTHLINTNEIEKLITPRTTAIMAVHTWGHPCNIEELSKIAKKYNLKLLFDSSHAFACSYKNKMIGGNGNAEVFSFHATKFFNTAEGGAITTNDDKLAKKIRLMKNFGFDGYDNVIYIGTNGKMNEFSAAIGLSNLDIIDDIINTNFNNYKFYKKELKNIKGITLKLYNEKEKCNFQYIVLEVDENNAGINRDELIKILHKENILARKYFFPGCHAMEPYKSYFPHSKLLLPQTINLVNRVISLPTGSSISEKDVSEICSIIKIAIENSVKIKKKLSNKIN